jgi:hypothetical protein
MKRAALFVLLCIATMPALAAMCAVDRVPAATLLYPYFIVDPVAFDRANTTLSVTNIAPTPVLVQLTLWTDGGAPVYSTPIHLGGRQARDISLRSLIIDGLRPSGIVSPGNMGTSGGSFGACSGVFSAQTVPSVELARMREALVGTANDQGVCGFDHGDGVLRGYATIDMRVACTALTPDQTGYHDNPAPLRNVLVGELVYSSVRDNASSSLPAVPVEIDTAGTVLLSGDRSFYGRYSTNATFDRREPLPTRWTLAAPENPQIGASDRLLVWRGGPVRANLCGGAGAPLPLSNTTPAIARDVAGTATSWSPAAMPAVGMPFTLATQAIDVATLFPGVAAAQIELRLQGDPGVDGQSWAGWLARRGAGFLITESALSGVPRDGNCRVQPLTVSGGGPSATPLPPTDDIALFIDSLESLSRPP